MFGKVNKWCTTCISFLSQDEYGGRACYGVEPLTADTEGCMHCHKPSSGNKVIDEISFVESGIRGCEGRIKETEFKKAKLEAKLKLLKKKL